MRGNKFLLAGSALAVLLLCLKPAMAATLVADAKLPGPVLAEFAVTQRLLGKTNVSRIQLLERDEAVPGATFSLPLSVYDLKGVKPGKLQGPAQGEYTLIVLKLAKGVTFAQCVEQMQKVLKLAMRYGATPLAFYRVEPGATGLDKADLVAVLGWKNSISALRFALKFNGRGGRNPRFKRRAAHALDDDTAFVVQAQRVAR